MSVVVDGEVFEVTNEVGESLSLPDGQPDGPAWSHRARAVGVDAAFEFDIRVRQARTEQNE